MLYVDVKYANIIGSRLQNYKRKEEYLWNFRCPVCGDSKTNTRKARGYIYKLKTGLAVKCHKCGYSTNIGNFIKYLDTSLYEEYVLENYKEGGAPRSSHKSVEIAIPDILRNSKSVSVDDVIEDDVFSPLKRLDRLSADHPAVKYVAKRLIPKDKWHLLYFCTRFKKYVNSIIPNKFKSLEGEHPRLIIPFFTPEGKCFAFQGRAFGNETPKYLTIKVDEDVDKIIYGLDRIDYSKRIYIVEGPLDSLFIPNCLAVSGSSFASPIIKAVASNATIVYDNERRSPELTKLIKQTIDSNYSVCLWPDNITEKDINEMIAGGRTAEQLIEIIDNNTFSGPEAQLRFATWRKC